MLFAGECCHDTLGSSDAGVLILRAEHVATGEDTRYAGAELGVDQGCAEF